MLREGTSKCGECTAVQGHDTAAASVCTLNGVGVK